MNILYTRVSTKNQGLSSLHNQKITCLNMLTKDNIIIDLIFQEISSAYKGPQIKLNKILNNYQDSNLYILNVSRFSRNVVEGKKMLKLAKSRNINIIFLEDSLESNNTNDFKKITKKLFTSEHRSENISTSLKDKFSSMKKNGHMIGRPGFGKKAQFIKRKRKFIEDSFETNIINFIRVARFGTSVKKLNKILHKMLPEAEDIEFIDNDGISKIQEFDKAKTLTYDEIAELLNNYKIRKRGKRWTANSVANIINNDSSCKRLKY